MMTTRRDRLTRGIPPPDVRKRMGRSAILAARASSRSPRQATPTEWLRKGFRKRLKVAVDGTPCQARAGNAAARNVMQERGMRLERRGVGGLGPGRDAGEDA